MQGGLEEVNPSKVDPSKVRKVTPKKGRKGIYVERKPGMGMLESQWKTFMSGVPSNMGS